MPARPKALWNVLVEDRKYFAITHHRLGIKQQINVVQVLKIHHGNTS